MAKEKIHINLINQEEKKYIDVDFRGDHKTLVSMVYTAMYGNKKLLDIIMDAASQFAVDMVIQEQKSRLN